MACGKREAHLPHESKESSQLVRLSSRLAKLHILFSPKGMRHHVPTKGLETLNDACLSCREAQRHLQETGPLSKPFWRTGLE